MSKEDIKALEVLMELETNLYFKKAIINAITELSKIDKLKKKLKITIKNIDDKLLYYGYDELRKIRLKAFRSKSKELLKELEG